LRENHQGFFIASLTRRHFLQALPATALLTKACSGHVDPIAKDKKIVVIGAGLSGLACARELSASGYSVQVLEASDRIGGRVLTHDSGVELGATLVHGGHSNPIFYHFERSRIALKKFEHLNTAFIQKANTADLSLMRDEWAVIDDELESSNGLSLLTSQARRFLRLPFPDSSMANFLESFFKSWDNQGEINKYAPAVYKEFFRQSYGADLDKLSLSNMWIESILENTGDSSVNNDELLSLGEFSKFPEKLSKGLDISYHHQVQLIQRERGQYLIRGNFEEILADCVVLAVPLGVLKKNMIQFNFDLPSSWRRGIDNLAISHLSKFILEFDSVFWPPDKHSLCIDAVGSYLECHYFLNMMPFTQKPMLVYHVAGLKALALEQMDEASALKQVLNILTPVFGDQIGKLVSFARTSWSQNEFSLGSYSHLPLNSRGDEFTLFTEPWRNDFWITGEFTSPSDPGTMHGAFLMGQALAKRMMGITF
jgi:monoamine oxidase